MTQAAVVATVPRTNLFGIRTVALSFPSGSELIVWDQSNERIASAVKVTVGYCRDRRSGSFIVTWPDNPDNPSFRHRRQQISVLPGAFFRILPQLDRRTIAQSITVNYGELVALGFVVPTVIAV